MGAVDVGICDKACLSLSCMSSCPPTGVFTFAKESCEAEMQERLCDGVVLDMCLPVRGREWQPGVTHLITQADWGLFLASSGTLLKLKLYAVFCLLLSLPVAALVWLSFIWNLIVLFFIYWKTWYHLTHLKVQHTTLRTPSSFCELTPWWNLNK